MKDNMYRIVIQHKISIKLVTWSRVVREKCRFLIVRSFDICKKSVLMSLSSANWENSSIKLILLIFCRTLALYNNGFFYIWSRNIQNQRGSWVSPLCMHTLQLKMQKMYTAHTKTWSFNSLIYGNNFLNNLFENILAISVVWGFSCIDKM